MKRKELLANAKQIISFKYGINNEPIEFEFIDYVLCYNERHKGIETHFLYRNNEGTILTKAISEVVTTDVKIFDNNNLVHNKARNGLIDNLSYHLRHKKQEVFSIERNRYDPLYTEFLEYLAKNDFVYYEGDNLLQVITIHHEQNG